jgi:hypothetical protein
MNNPSLTSVRARILSPKSLAIQVRLNNFIDVNASLNSTALSIIASEFLLGKCRKIRQIASLQPLNGEASLRKNCAKLSKIGGVVVLAQIVINSDGSAQA